MWKRNIIFDEADIPPKKWLTENRIEFMTMEDKQIYF